MHKVINLGDQLLDAAEGPATDRLLRDSTEPEFDLIEPGCVRRRVVDMIAGADPEPRSDLGMFVGGIVVDDEMDIEVLRDTGVQVAQKREEFLMAMSPADIG